MRSDSRSALSVGSSSPLALLALLALVVLGQAASACAQDGDRRARAAFERAVVALRDGQFAQARDLFERSIEESPSAAAAFNLAVACRGTGEGLRAEAVLDQLLTGRFGELTESRRREVTLLRDEIAAEAATLSLTVRGPSGSVRWSARVDGRLIAQDTATLRLDPGRHIIVVAADGFVEEERRVALERGASVGLEVVLEARPELQVGRLVLEAPSEDLGVEILGVARGNGAIERELRPGDYVVRVTRGEVRRESTVRVEGGATTRFRFDDPTAGLDLTREPAFWVIGGVVVVGGILGGVLGALYGQPVAAPIADPEYGVIVALGAP